MKLTEFSDNIECVEEMKKIMELYIKVKDTEIFKTFYEEESIKRIKIEKQQI